MMTKEPTTFKLTLPIKLRPCVAEDLPKLEWYGQYIHFRRIYQATFQDQLLGRRLMVVADLNNFPVGQIFVHMNLGINDHGHARGYLYSLRVIDHLQGQGLGTRLLRYAEETLLARGFDRALISAAITNLRARNLYERLGYQVIGKDEGRWKYTNHQGQVVHMHEPCWMLEKNLR